MNMANDRIKAKREVLVGRRAAERCKKEEDRCYCISRYWTRPARATCARGRSRGPVSEWRNSGSRGMTSWSKHRGILCPPGVPRSLSSWPPSTPRMPSRRKSWRSSAGSSQPRSSVLTARATAPWTSRSTAPVRHKWPSAGGSRRTRRESIRLIQLAAREDHRSSRGGFFYFFSWHKNKFRVLLFYKEVTPYALVEEKDERQRAFVRSGGSVPLLWPMARPAGPAKLPR